MSGSHPGVRDIHLHRGTGPVGRRDLAHRMVWAMTIGDDAILVPIGSPVKGLPKVLVAELPHGVLTKTSCLLLGLAKRVPARALGDAIRDGTHPHLGTCSPDFLEKVLAALALPIVPPNVRTLLPPGHGGVAPRRPTLPPVSGFRHAQKE